MDKETFFHSVINTSVFAVLSVLVIALLAGYIFVHLQLANEINLHTLTPDQRDCEFVVKTTNINFADSLVVEENYYYEAHIRDSEFVTIWKCLKHE